MTRAQTQQALRQLPVKWALGLLALIVVYALAQPALNSRFGWHLPSLAKLMGEPESRSPSAGDRDSGKSRGGVAGAPATRVESTSSTADAEAENAPTQAKKTEPAKASDFDDSASKATGSKSPAKTAKASQRAESAPAGSTLLYGVLKETGRDRYVSAEGLQYNPGSEEGHRLKHLERHLSDIPNRPQKHGVFDGDMSQVLRWIDDAYARGKRGAKGVRKTVEEDRTIYEVPFNQPIGYIGGRDGKRDGNPPARRLRLVVEGNRFITAFPF